MKLKNSILVVILICTFVISLSPTDMLAQDGVQCQDEYTVQQEDWLSKIAEKYLGDALVYELIVQANNAQSEDSYPDITDPDLIEPGWLLCIPQVSSTPETEVESNSNPAEDVKLLEFKASSGQFMLSYPESWTMVEYEDGSGVILANSGASLTRYQQGLAPASGDQVLNISLTPTVLFQSLYIQVAPGMSAEELAGTLLSKFGAIDGISASEPELAQLTDGREIALKKGSSAQVEGAVMLFEVSEGVIALGSAVGFPNEYESLQASVLTVLSSLQFQGTIDTLTAVIDPTPPMAGPTR